MSQAMSPVWITGSGVVSCAGLSPEELWTNILKNKSGIKDGLGYARKPEDNLDLLAIDFCRKAAAQAMKQAGWGQLNSDDGIILASTTGQILNWGQSWVNFVGGSADIFSFRKAFKTQPLGTLLTELGPSVGNPGHQQVIGTACTAATQALALAALWIQTGRVKRCLVGGVEVLCDLTVEGFRSLQLLSPNLCTPFEKNRAGINLSEGAAFVCLESDSAQISGRALARISGSGMSTDAHHITSPHPEGRGCAQAIERALKTAGIKPSGIDWIHAHGTGSHYNDLSEGLAFKSIFGDHKVPVASTKPIHGHALGASGLLETIICLQALKNQTVIATPNLQNIDTDIPVFHPPQASQPAKLNHILKTTLGFGGANAALVISHAKAVQV